MNARPSLLLLLLMVLPSVTAAGPAPKRPALDRTAEAAAVRAEFLHAWQAYEKHAWGHDELKPVSKTTRDWYGESLEITPVDSLDTLLLMGLTEEAEKAKALILEKLSFDKDVPVKNFEVTIRLLGGLLSSYQKIPV
jgi:mannosidase alpha-like ER degradation enhancer 2